MYVGRAVVQNQKMTRQRKLPASADKRHNVWKSDHNINTPLELSRVLGCWVAGALTLEGTQTDKQAASLVEPFRQNPC